MQKNKHLSQLELDEYMLCINSQIQPEGQHSAVDRFLGRSVLNFIPNSFNDQFVWQDAIKARSEVREKRVNKKSRGCKEAFYPGQPVLLQDHISRKWDQPGIISKVREAPCGKILSYEIITDKGHTTTRHRSMIKSVPNINNESADLPIVDDSGEDPKDDDQTNKWSRGERLRAKKALIHEDLILKTSTLAELNQQHEAEYPISNPEDQHGQSQHHEAGDQISSPAERCQHGNNFFDQASKNIMKAQSAHSESHARSVVTEKAIATRPSRANSALAESPFISTIVEEQRAPATSLTSYTTFRRGSQARPLASVTGCLAPGLAGQESLSLIEGRFEEQICKRKITRIYISRSLRMSRTTCSGTCCLIAYALAVTVGLVLSVVICIATSKEFQLFQSGKNLTDFQQSQATQTVYEANIFSSIQETGVEMVKEEEQGRCPVTQYRLPPIL